MWLSLHVHGGGGLIFLVGWVAIDFGFVGQFFVVFVFAVKFPKAVNVSGVISSHGTTSLKIMSVGESLTAKSYLTILKQHHIPRCRALFPENDFVWIQVTATFAVFSSAGGWWWLIYLCPSSWAWWLIGWSIASHSEAR